jgi:triosephosphate isomerase
MGADMLRKHVIGNWKMNGSATMLAEVLGGLRVPSYDCDVTICVPYPYLAQASTLLEGSACQLGGQNVCRYDDGAFTGEVSAKMLREFGCALVIIGHSERRLHFAEDDACVAEKFDRALADGLYPVVCVGETLAERDAGGAEEKISKQLAWLRGRIVAGCRVEQFCVAYEPVWAIGTGRTASAEQVEAMHRWIRDCLGVPVLVLYGGSVKASNAAELMAIPGVDGVLVGGASLDAEAFTGICRAASN